MSIEIHEGDCREVIPTLGELAGAVVCDPPYGLEFMGRGWDKGVPGVEFWDVISAGMKPGAMLLAFGGTRTFHRLTCAIEDAGLEIRDCVMWVYGSGFPKSLDIGKAIDKAAGVEREETGRVLSVTGNRASASSAMATSGLGAVNAGAQEHRETAPATPEAQQWDGWGTALKPAWEPIIVARKPLEGTVAQNVLRHGVGGINVDGCRVGTSKSVPASAAKSRVGTGGNKWHFGDEPQSGADPNVGRFPANLIHDGSEEVVGLFPSEAGGGSVSAGGDSAPFVYGDGFDRKAWTPDEKGSAARFFYCAKASGTDRGNRVTEPAMPLFGAEEQKFRNTHPTVKPTELMEYLIRLVLPPGEVVLDPFMGSGSTLVAAQNLGQRAIGIDLQTEYCDIAATRLGIERARTEIL